MAGGAVVVVEGKRTVLHGSVGRGTNNEAEYEGLILGLDHALRAGADSVQVYGDSQLVLRQLEGRYQVKADNLKPLYERARRLLSSFREVRLEWVRREQNRDADQAANEALDRA
jgi:ribonuclease HI